MSKTVVKELLAAVEELERLPIDHPMRIIPIALRECDIHLVEHALIGGTGAMPIIWNRIIAIGNLQAETMVAWGMYPPLAGRADFEEVALVKSALMKERVSACYVDALSRLKRTGILTGAIALYGEDANGKTVLLIGRHPDLSRAKAVCVLLGAILSAEAQVGSAAN
jgi:hypothetical protein